MCGCRKNKTQTASQTAQMTVADPRKIPMKIKLQNYSEQPRAVVGTKTKISYGKHKDGDVFLVWKADVLAAPKFFEVLQEGGQPKK